MELRDLFFNTIFFIKQTQIKHDNIQMFLFGSSSINNNQFHDIDILVLYKSEKLLQSFKDEVAKFKYASLIHLTCLTIKEEKELDFIKKQNAISVKELMI